MVKSARLHFLCQTRQDYRAMWDHKLDGSRRAELLERRERVLERVRKTDRLLSWIVFFRKPGELGVGDTTIRLISAGCRTKGCQQIRAVLKSLLKQYACDGRKAVDCINERYPYAPPPSK